MRRAKVVQNGSMHDNGSPSFVWRELMATPPFAVGFRIQHSIWKCRTRCRAATTPTVRASGSSGQGVCPYRKHHQARLQVVNEWCAASARTRAIHSASGTPKRVESSKAVTSSSSKYPRTCFPLPGGFRRYGLEAPSFDLSDNSLDDHYTLREGMIRDAEDYTSVLSGRGKTNTLKLYCGTLNALMKHKTPVGRLTSTNKFSYTPC